MNIANVVKNILISRLSLTLNGLTIIKTKKNCERFWLSFPLAFNLHTWYISCQRLAVAIYSCMQLPARAAHTHDVSRPAFRKYRSAIAIIRHVRGHSCTYCASCFSYARFSFESRLSRSLRYRDNRDRSGSEWLESARRAYTFFPIEYTLCGTLTGNAYSIEPLSQSFIFRDNKQEVEKHVKDV